MATTYGTVGFILAAVLLAVTLIVRDRMRTTVIDPRSRPHRPRCRRVRWNDERARVRPARSTAEALQELWRYAGTQFDADVVQALAAVAHTLHLDDARTGAAPAVGPRAALVNFPRL
jgi:hypothetical protein